MFWLLLFSSLALADDDIVTLQKGERAPFSGTLLSPEAAAKLLADEKNLLAQCRIDAKRDLALLQAESDLKFRNKEAELTACHLKSTEQEKIYKEHVEYLESRSISPNWERPVTFAGGVLTGVGVVALSAWILNQIGGQQ